MTRVSFATSGCALCSHTGVPTGLRGGGYLLTSDVLNPFELSQAGPLGLHFPLLVENLGAHCPGRTLRAKSVLPKCKHPAQPGGWGKGGNSDTEEGPAPLPGPRGTPWSSDHRAAPLPLWDREINVCVIEGAQNTHKQDGGKGQPRIELSFDETLDSMSCFNPQEIWSHFTPWEITEPPSMFPAYSSEVLFQISLFVLKVLRRTSPRSRG